MQRIVATIEFENEEDRLRIAEEIAGSLGDLVESARINLSFDWDPDTQYARDFRDEAAEQEGE